MVSGTIEPMGTMLAGQGVDALYASIMHVPLLSVGLNCATGPEFMTDHIRTLVASWRGRCVSCYPNAGLPDEDGRYPRRRRCSPRALERFVDKGWLNIVGGCCGTTPGAHPRARRRSRGQAAPARSRSTARRSSPASRSSRSTRTTGPVLVGERTNVIGSRKFKRLIAEGKCEEAAEIARAQVKGGAQIIDVCLQDPDRDEIGGRERLPRARDPEGQGAAHDRLDRRAACSSSA